MLNFSKTDSIDALMVEVGGLPAITESLTEDVVSQVKDVAITLLKAARTETVSHATLNLRAHFLPSLKSRQVEIQVIGRPAPAARKGA